MAKIKAFAAIRPEKTLTERIAALPYDVYNRKEARAEVKREPMSFLKIDRAETQLEEGADIYAPEVYKKAHDTLWEMVEKGEFVRDPKPCYYLYELTMQGRTQTGLVACASIDDYENGVIKKHENTREEKEEDRIRHVDACDAQTGPIFLAYRRNSEMEALTRRIEQTPPLFEFTGMDQVTHRGYLIDCPEDIRRITEIFAGIEKIYIADGHHRAASAVKVGEKRRAAHPGYDGTEEFNWFLSVLFPDDELKILDYNRVVKDLNGLTETEFLEKVREKFEVSQSPVPVVCSRKGEVGMYLKDAWYALKIKPEFTSPDPVEGLDVSILQRELLAPVLGIGDPKTDTRIDFIGGIRGLAELERRVHTDSAVAFAMYPTSIGELFDVADAGRLMPPKSTWFEPKLRSGLFLHEIDR
ncbi:MAG: DUF1015 family protein [Candidatus Limivivens sp.]|nr:DUF1015 family protein [Candidatus Limivivens sp.]